MAPLGQFLVGKRKGVPPGAVSPHSCRLAGFVAVPLQGDRRPRRPLLAPSINDDSRVSLGAGVFLDAGPVVFQLDLGDQLISPPLQVDARLDSLGSPHDKPTHDKSNQVNQRWPEPGIGTRYSLPASSQGTAVRIAGPTGHAEKDRPKKNCIRPAPIRALSQAGRLPGIDIA